MGEARPRGPRTVRVRYGGQVLHFNMGWHEAVCAEVVQNGAVAATASATFLEDRPTSSARPPGDP